jgi:membrane-associated phospholipid phosphatase
LPTERRANRFAFGALVAAAAFGLLGLLVAEGVLSGVDDFAAQHLMPFAGGPGGGTSRLGELLDYPSASFHLGGALRVPASPACSSLLALLLAVIFWRRGQGARAVLWLGGFAVANLVELTLRIAVEKPAIYAYIDGARRPMGFLHSFPSGHATRSLLLAAMATAVWTRLWPLFAVWAIAVVVSAELDGIHTPSDIAGGLLLATAVICAVLAAGARERWETPLTALLRRSSLRSPLARS